MKLAKHNIHLRQGEYREACDLVLRYHYSRRVPANVQLVCTAHVTGGLFGDAGECVGACMFSIPPTRWSEEVLELSRLVRHDGYEYPITLMIGFALRCAFKKHDLIVSFADKTHGHEGIVYRASNFNYHGLRSPRMDGVMMGGVFMAGRSCNSAFGTRSPTKLSARMGVEVVGHFDEGKHLYWMARSKDGFAKADRLGLQRSSWKA